MSCRTHVFDDDANGVAESVRRGADVLAGVVLLRVIDGQAVLQLGVPARRGRPTLIT